MLLSANPETATEQYFLNSLREILPLGTPQVVTLHSAHSGVVLQAVQVLRQAGNDRVSVAELLAT